MKRNKWIFALVLVLIVCMLPLNQLPTSAAVDSMVVVSLGDSYSAGEGIEPFYGQDKVITEKIKDRDWLAHRSQKGWPTMLKVPGYSGTTGEHRVFSNNDSDFQWYFAASSGAVSAHVYREGQKKKAVQYIGGGRYKLTNEDTLPKQVDIFEGLYGTVDYVTMTMGGNDVDFSKIITSCATGSTYLGTSKLEEQLKVLWDDMEYIRTCLKNTYEEIESKAGPQADIIIAGYPKLLDKQGKGALISKDEATTVNDNVNKFNDEIEGVVNNCRLNGMNIHFVDVEGEFDEGDGHQAYSSDAWINKIYLRKSQDIDSDNLVSAYSIHPNQKGAEAYARCVNAKIAEIENNKARGTLSGKICKATDRITPVSNAQIRVYKDGVSYVPNVNAHSDGNGNYSVSLEEGFYKIEIGCFGYVTFSSYATVTKNQNTYMETFLLVQGAPGEKDYAKGTITNALTGSGVANANIEVREGWNNTEYGEIIATGKTDANGKYSIFLPVGNFTLNISKPGFIPGMVNVIVQRDLNISQNGSISPIGNGEDYRIVLTWGENPRDLDSHVVGRLYDDTAYHVYYGHKSQYDGDQEICNLDVDDVTSYGPETITLKAVSQSPYYYYIHRYSGSGTVATSEAVIKIYQGSELIQKINVPTDLGSGDYWNVFAIVNGQIKIKNTISNSPNTTYANTSESQIARYSLFDDYTSLLLKDAQVVKEKIEEAETKETEAAIEEEMTEETEITQESTTEIDTEIADESETTNEDEEITTEE